MTEEQIALKEIQGKFGVATPKEIGKLFREYYVKYIKTKYAQASDSVEELVGLFSDPKI